MRYLNLGLLTSLALAATSAEATLIGDTVTGDFREFTNSTSTGGGVPNGFGENQFDPITAVVGSGTEFTSVSDAISGLQILADLSSETLVIDYSWTGPSGPFGISRILQQHLLRFGDLDWVGESGTIVGFDLSSSGGMLPTPYETSFGGDWVQILFLNDFGLDSPGGFHLEFDIEVEHASPVPDTTASMTLMGLGLAGLFIFCRGSRLHRSTPGLSS